ncbi:MAG TPA: sigma-70 family RNA polymerase sigma factor [Sphingobacteriaceae bacterium]
MAAPEDVTTVVDKLYRRHFGRLVAAILRHAGLDDIETAEDLVQETFLAACKNWTEHVIPEKPEAWLFRVCRNKALNLMRAANNEEPQVDTVQFAADLLDEDAIKDDLLKMLFACASPVISPRAQVIMILKYVVNLRTEEIAAAFGSGQEAITKLLQRSRLKFQEGGINVRLPLMGQPQERLPVVHKAIYLIFNAGYKASGDRVINADLCLEAVALMRALLESEVCNHETKPLYALLLFNASRFEARTGAGGELLDLENQDRLRWSHPMVSLATAIFRSCRHDEMLSVYHIEASISYLHCISPSFGETDWRTIAGLYLRLKQYNPSPFVELSRATAVLFSGEPALAMSILNELGKQHWMAKYYLFQVTRGKVLKRLGKNKEALTCFRNALLRISSVPEQQYIGKLILEAELQVV